MPLCGLKIGDHVWRVIGRDKRERVIVMRSPCYVPWDGTAKPELDPDHEIVDVFIYNRTNQNGIDEYYRVYAGRVEVNREVTE